MDIGTAIFLMAIVGLVVWRLSTLGNRTSSRGGTYTVPPPTPAPVSPNTQSGVLVGLRSYKRLILILGGVAVALVIIILLVMSIGDDVVKVMQGTDVPFMVATLVVIALAVLGAMGKAGGPGKWALGIVAILAILFVLNELMLKVSYGDQADAVREARTKRSADAILHPSQSTASAYTQASATALRQVITLSLKAGQAKPLRVTGDQCILWWGADPDGHAFTTEARHEILPPWRSWEEWQTLRATGRVGNPGWLRFTATNGDTEVNYELRRDGEC